MFVGLLGILIGYLVVIVFVDDVLIIMLINFEFGKVNCWYIDVMFVVNYLVVLVLCVVFLFSYGGLMLWVNIVVVYVELFELFKCFIENLWVLYINCYDYVMIKLLIVV